MAPVGIQKASADFTFHAFDETMRVPMQFPAGHLIMGEPFRWKLPFDMSVASM